MTRFIAALCLLIASASTSATERFDPQQFAEDYFNAWAQTQAPDATLDDIHAYLNLLTDDVGHQHLPYDPDDSREAGNKDRMLEGMTYYLAAHTDYEASLSEVMVLGDQVVVIKYQSHRAGVHPQTGETSEKTFQTIEMLELEDGKVATIRKHTE